MACIRMDGSASWMSNSNYDDDSGGMSIGSAIIAGGQGGKRRRRPLATGYIPGSSVGGKSAASVSGAAASATSKGSGMYSSVVNRVSPSELLKMSSTEAEERSPQIRTRRQKRQQQTLISPSLFHQHHTPASSPQQRVPPSPGGSRRNYSGPLHERELPENNSFNQACSSANAMEDSPATKLLFGPGSSVPPMSFGDGPISNPQPTPAGQHLTAHAALSMPRLHHNHHHTTSASATTASKPHYYDREDERDSPSSIHPQSPIHLASGTVVVAQISSSSFTPRGREATNIYSNSSIGNASDSATTLEPGKPTPVIIHAGPLPSSANGSVSDALPLPPTPGVVGSPLSAHHRSKVNVSIVGADMRPIPKDGSGGMGGMSMTTDALYQSIHTLHSGECSSDGSDIGDDELLLNGSFVNTDMRVLAGLNEALADRERAMALAESNGDNACVLEGGPDGAPVVTDKKMRSRARSRARSIRHALAASGLSITDRSFNSNSNNSPAGTSSLNIATPSPTQNINAASNAHTNDDVSGTFARWSPDNNGGGVLISVMDAVASVGMPIIGSDEHRSSFASHSQWNSTSTHDDCAPLGLILNHDAAQKSGSHHHLLVGSSSSAPPTPSKHPTM
jgi:hypothetical protein